MSSGTHGIVATDANVGATIGTFDDVNTRNGTFRLTAGAKGIHGLSFAGARIAQTTADAQLWRLRITSDDLDMPGNVNTYALGLVNGAAVATNDQGFFVPAIWLPVDYPAVGGASLAFAFSQAGLESADSVSVAAGCHYYCDEVPAAFLQAAYIGRGGTLPAQGGLSGNGTSISAATRTSLGTLTIPATRPFISAVMLEQAPDPVPTGGEESVGFAELTSTEISDLAPQEYPIPAISPMLGTPVGGPIYGQQSPLPAWISTLTGGTMSASRIVDCFVTLSTAVTAAHAFNWGVDLRRTPPR